MTALLAFLMEMLRSLMQLIAEGFFLFLMVGKIILTRFQLLLLDLFLGLSTLVALLMAIGIMMDDAIVLAESIAAHLDRGMELDDAVIQGVQKVMPGVLLVSDYHLYLWWLAVP